MMAGCGKSDTKSEAKKDSYTIGIEQFAEHGSLDNCREGFLKGLEDELNQQDTGIVGLDAAKEYLKNVKEVSSGTLDDSLVKEQKKRPLCVRML